MTDPHPMSRRAFALGALLLPLPLACQQREPETPLAHLYGRDWVRGAYSHYARAYAGVEQQAQTQSFGAYRLLAHDGVAALSALQAREVPFYVRVSPDNDRFRIEREVPERLTFSAEMSAEEREAATRIWQAARDHIHRDYAEIRRLENALTTLLSEVGRVRVAIDEGRLEQYRIARQLSELGEGGALPFELPYQVSRADYQSVLLLLLERLDADRKRLAGAEASMVAVGLVARATDAGSASLAPNVHKVLLAVAEDSRKVEEARRATDYPEAAGAREPLLARARALHAALVASPEYRAWLAAEREREDQLGRFLTVLDAMTGLGISAVYRQVLRIWRGDGDYLEYLRLAAGLLPGGTGLSGVLNGAVEGTQRYRELVSTGARARAVLARASDAEGGALEVENAVVNVGTRRAQQLLDRQLVFFEQRDEIEDVKSALARTALFR